MDTIKVSKSDPAFRRIIVACYPTWKGRKVCVKAATTYRMANYWGGGSRDYAVAYDLKTGDVSAPSVVTTNPMRGQAHAVVEIPEGMLIVEHSIFCGKDAGVTIYVNPANMPRLLPDLHPPLPATDPIDDGVPCLFPPRGVALQLSLLGGPPTSSYRCWHRGCQIATIDDPRVRARLMLNGEIRWHLLENWARFERATPRGSAARNRLARLILAIRRAGKLDLGVAVPALLWAAATTQGR